jgi:ABC-2 type transport system permease protein
VLWSIFPLITTALLTAKSKHFYSWSSDELFLLTAYFTFFFGLYNILFGRSFKRFARLSQFGQLDTILLKPVDSQFMISFWHTNFANLARLVVGATTLFVVCQRLHINFSLALFIEMSLITSVGVVTLYAIWFSVLTLTIWFAQLSNLRDLLITLNGITRYPPDIFQHTLLFVFFLPLAVVIATPTKLLLQKTSWVDIALLVTCAGIFFICSRLFWRFALRSYSSAGG